MSTGDAFCPPEINPRDADILWQFRSQNGVIKDQLNIGFQAITAGCSATRASRNGVLSFPITPCSRLQQRLDQLLH